MHELRILTMTGQTLSFCSPRQKVLRRQLASFQQTFGIRDYALRDASGWYEGRDPSVSGLDDFSALPSRILWNEEMVG